jgi:hypothetical protein
MRAKAAWLFLSGLLLQVGCGYGYQVVRNGPDLVVENRGDVRYYYQLRRTLVEDEGPAAIAVVGVPPPGLREVGAIFVTPGYTGWGADGVRTGEQEFFPLLAELAGKMGGSHFFVVRVSRDRMGNINGLTASVLRPGT